jgi:small subunit ribosomal protein S6
MRKYEMMFIIRPDATEEEADQLIGQMENEVASAGGKVEKVDKMGRRRLAYRVKRFQEGIYVLFTLEGSGDLVKGFERRLRVTDAVIKFMAVRIDEESKRAEKLKAQRAGQAGRKPRSAGAATPAPPAASPSAPAAAEPTQA